MRRTAITLGLVLVAVALAPLSASAQPATEIARFSLVLVSDPDDFIGQGGTYVFEHADGRAGMVSWGDQRQEFDMAFGNGESGGYFEIAAPPGEKIKPGYYPHAQRAPFRDEGRPGIDISMDSRGCNTIAGWFDVKYIDFNSDGSVRRARITFAQHCEGDLDALYGELRIGRGATAHSVAVVPDHLTWPAVEVGATLWSYPVYVVPLERDVRIRSAVRRGPHRDDFEEDANSCTDVTLSPGRGCGVIVRFAPKQGGPRSAPLVVDHEGRTHRVVMEALAVSGRSRVVMHSEPGDYIGQGRTWEFSSINGDWFWSWRIKDFGVETWVDATDGSDWRLDFGAAGDLQEGTT